MAALQPPAAPPVTPLERMRREPQLLQLCVMARQNPALLRPLLEELNRSAPQIVQLVQQDQAAFQELLNDPTPSAAQSTPPAAPAAPPAPPQEVPPPAEPQQVSVQLTPAEAEAVQRLCKLGLQQSQGHGA